MSPELTSRLFLGAAIFNWVVGLALFFAPHLFLDLFLVTPGPEQAIWVQQFAGLVLVFGLGYYWASRDFERNVQIVRLAVWGKLGVVLVGLLNVVTDDVSWQFMIPASADGIFAGLFVQALRSRPRWQSGGVV